MRHVAIRTDDVGSRLDRALVASARVVGIEAIVTDHRARPWASATFAGAQHAVTLSADRVPALGRWIADLPDVELIVRGHLVADCTVDRIEDDGATVRVTLIVLTVEN